MNLLTTGQDPLSHEIKLFSLALPNDMVHSIDCQELGRSIVSDLVWLVEERSIKKVLHDAKPALASLRASVDRKLAACNVFDLMLASQICWSGYYYFAPSGRPGSPWKKRTPDHGLASLAERHLGARMEHVGSGPEDSAVLLPLHHILAELLARNGLQKIADLEFRAISPLVEMEISGIHLECRAARSMVEQKEMELCHLFCTMQDEAQKKGFVTVSRDDKRLLCYLNPDRREDVRAFLEKRGYAVGSTKALVLRELAAAASRLR